MKPAHVLAVVLCLTALAGAAAVSACLAGQLFFVFNKMLPPEFALDTWYRHWLAYRDDPVQHARLVAAAVVAPLLVFGLPALACLSQATPRRSLYGDARWANPAEIKEAGLL